MSLIKRFAGSRARKEGNLDPLNLKRDQDQEALASLSPALPVMMARSFRSQLTECTDRPLPEASHQLITAGQREEGARVKRDSYEIKARRLGWPRFGLGLMTSIRSIRLDVQQVVYDIGYRSDGEEL